MPHSRSEDEVRGRRVDDNPTDAARRVQPHVPPRLTGIGRLIDAVAVRNIATNERLAGACPDNVRIHRVNS